MNEMAEQVKQNTWTDFCGGKNRVHKQLGCAAEGKDAA